MEGTDGRESEIAPVPGAGDGWKMKRYLEKNVYQAALDRINHVIDTFDRVFVSFSGGKDSLAVLHLVEEVYRARGIHRPIDVIFRDEELIQDDVIDFVLQYRENPRYNFRYYAVQQSATKYVLGTVQNYIQWDVNRLWIRPKPSFAMALDPARVYDQNTMDRWLFEGIPGKIAFLMGIRADESMVRMQSVMKKTVDNYITKPMSDIHNVRIVKPIYDWREKDVFRYFFEHKIQYCPTYDVQLFAGKALRVATAVNQQAAKQFHLLRRMHPVLYEQIITIFPEMLLQERYYKDMDRESVFDQYAHTFDGVVQYIQDTVPDAEKRKLFIGYVRCAEHIRATKPKSKNLGGYPVLHVFKQIYTGNKQMIQPKGKPSPKDLLYEGLS